MSNPQISILMLSYNSDWVKTRQTLYSILMQKDVDFEIIVTDDGSENNNFDKIRQYFFENHFSNFILVENNENQGTVKNALSGLKFVNSKWVKPISAGDFLYNPFVLKMCLNYMKENDAAAYFGTAIYYSNEQNKIELFLDRNAPHDIRPYLKNKKKLIKYNLFYIGDYILGASLIYDTAKWIYCLNMMKDFVRFAEDLSVLYLVAYDEDIKYISLQGDYFMWYEFGSGNSTNNDTKIKRILHDEGKNVFVSLVNMKKISKRLIKFRFNVSKCIFKRLFTILFSSPSMLLRKILFINPDRLRGYKKFVPNPVFLQDILNS